MWNTIINFFDKINKAIPLDAIFWAGVAVAGIMLVLVVLSCILKKRLAPMLIVWLYFIFSATVIMANPAVTIINALLYLEFPILVVLFCYLFVLVFKRLMRPRTKVVSQKQETTVITKSENDEAEKIEIDKNTKEEKTLETEDSTFNFNLDEIDNEVKDESEPSKIAPVQEEPKEVKVEPRPEPKIESTPRPVFSFPTTNAMPRETVTPRPAVSPTSTPTYTPRYTTSASGFSAPTTPASSGSYFGAKPATPTQSVRPATPSSSNATPSSTGTSKSAQDVLDAIARLRASMNNKK